MSDLAAKRCRPVAAGTAPLAPDAAAALLSQLEGWTLGAGGGAIERGFEFPTFHDTMAFVNAVAWVAHREDHHPDLEVGYGRCLVRFSTHAVGGLSENDFIAAAKVDALGR
jgi:4a-hydroxytetrahydrobiopterin dehydratase